MSEVDRHSRTEQPTGKRLGDAKKKGIPTSRDLTASVTLLVAIVTLYSTGGLMFETLKNLSREIFGGLAAHELTQAAVYSLLIKLFGVFGKILAPFVITIIVTGVVVSIIQEGEFSVNFERLGFKLDALNPANGIKKLKFFKRESLVELFKSFLKIIIIAWFAYRLMRDEVMTMSYLTERDLAGIFAFAGHISFKLVLNICGVMFILGILDLIYVKWDFIQNIKMTKQEVKDEHKDSEGNPEVKQKIRKMQMEKTMKRLIRTVPQADVVITNPTHYSVALKYDREKMAAPVVVAKGVDFFAHRIKEIAREHHIVLVENRFLARELYAKVKEGQEIPESLYAAVAEVLAYVYRLKGKV